MRNLTTDYVISEILDTVSLMQLNKEDVPIIENTQIDEIADRFLFEWNEVGDYEADFSRTLLEYLRDEFVINKKKPLLGICVGLQMFADIGFEETETIGLGWIPGKVSKIDNQNGKFKLPHIGWNQIDIIKKDSRIFNNIENNSHMYFVHSYEFIPNDKTVISATTNYSSKIICSVERENIFGTQFHPEKSDKLGLKILENFIKIK